MEPEYIDDTPRFSIVDTIRDTGDDGPTSDRGFQSQDSLGFETFLTNERSHESPPIDTIEVEAGHNGRERAERQRQPLQLHRHSTSSIQGANHLDSQPQLSHSSHSWQERASQPEMRGSPGASVTSPTLSQGLGRTMETADEEISGHGLALSEDAGKESGQAEAPPPWSELKTKAGKERKRLPLACIACRRKKIRCSGEKPTCKHCLRSRIPCVYKITARKAAPRTDYMAMLDRRLKRMEDRVIKIIPREEQDIVASTGRANVKPPPPEVLAKAGVSQKKRLAEQAFNQELDGWAAMDAGTTAGQNKAPSKDSDTKMGGNNNEDNSLLTEGSKSLPSYEVQEHLAEVFFEFVYGQSYHLLHKPSFVRRLAQGAIPPVLILSVCAVSARFSNHPSVRTEPAFLRGESWAAAARKIALERYDTPNITILIVLLILGLHEFGTCQGGRSWMLGGIAQRMAYALRLHQDLDYDPKNLDGKSQGLTATDREIRRRTMWSCFLMDRFNSSGTDRPLFVSEQYIRAQLPIRENLFQMEVTGPTEDLEGSIPKFVPAGDGQLANATTNMGVAAYLVRLVAIWGHLVRYLNLGGREKDSHPLWDESSTFQSIQRSTEAWLFTLPASLTYGAENLANHVGEKTANQYLFMHIVYHQTILFMNRFALPAPGSFAAVPRDMPPDFIQKSSKAAQYAANRISELVHEAMDHAVVAPFAGYCAFYSSTVHINGAFSKDAALEASSKLNLACNVKYLTKMKKYWGMFHYMTENLRELYRRHADAARHGASTPKWGQTNQRIFQYGDWFDRYPHGVSGTDYDEPSTKIKTETSADGVLGQTNDLQTVEEFFSKMMPPSQAMRPGTESNGHHQGRRKKRTKSQASRAQLVRPSDAVDRQPQQSEQISTVSEKQNFSGAGDAMQKGSVDVNDHMLIDQGMASEPFVHAEYSILLQPGISQPTLHDSTAQFMSQLDRQLVLNSYGSIDMAANHNAIMTSNSQGVAHLGQGTFDQFGLDAFSSSSNVDGGDATQQQQQQQPQQSRSGEALSGEYWGDPSTAWFMPFNVEPPSVRDENDLSFGGLNPVDWADPNAFGHVAPGISISLGTRELEGKTASEMMNDSLDPGYNGINTMKDS